MNKLFPDDKILVTKHFDAHQDWEVPIEGFFIIASKETHIKSIAEFNEEQAIEFINILTRVRRAMKQVLGIEKVMLFQNEASIHGFHIWLFPFLPWMREFGTDIKSVRDILAYADEHFTTPENIQKIKETTKKVADYLKSP